MSAESALGLLGFVGVVGLGVSLAVANQRRYTQEIERRRASARAQVLEYRASSADARYAFDGQTATIVLEQESIQGGRSTAEHFSLTCYASNEAGEYFMFVSDGVSKPFFKHVEPRIARLVLKDKFREPRSD